MTDNEKLIGESVRRRILNRELKRQIDEEKTKNRQLQEQLDSLQKKYDELESEVNGYLDEVEQEELDGGVDEDGQPFVDDRDAELAALRTQLLRTKIETKFGEVTKGRLNDGVNFDHVLRNMPDLDLSQLDDETLDDEFYTGLVSAAQEQAPYLFRPQQDAAAKPTDGAGQNAGGAKRQLPTFLQRSSGGGTPPPVESQSLTATRLRDPAEAIKRAAAARESAATGNG